jgi:hypothetical protein
VVFRELAVLLALEEAFVTFCPLDVMFEEELLIEAV